MADMDRIGLFREMPYVTIGCPYQSTSIKYFTGKNFKTPGSKEPCGNNDGYFNDFQRLFDGEKGMITIYELRRMWRRNANLKNLGKVWVPSNGDIKQSGVGSRAGGFYPIIPAFGSATRTYPYVHEKKNFITNPGQKGSGYGYNNICLSRYPEYILGNKYVDFETLYKKLDEYHELKVAGRPVFKPPNGFGDYFNKNPFVDGSNATRPPKATKPIDKPFIVASYPKKDGGMKAGTFSPFPAYAHCPYLDTLFYLKKEVLNKEGKRFLPNSNFKTYFPTNSVLQQNVKFRINNTNMGKISSVY